MAMHSLWGFSGSYRDPVSAGYPLGNGYRVYLPSLMRFSTPDGWSPFGEGGANAYAYCEADPINHVDPSGHAPFPIFALAQLGKATLRDIEEDAAISVKEAVRASDLAVADSSGVARRGILKRSEKSSESVDHAAPKKPKVKFDVDEDEDEDEDEEPSWTWTWLDEEYDRTSSIRRPRSGAPREAILAYAAIQVAAAEKRVGIFHAAVNAGLDSRRLLREMRESTLYLEDARQALERADGAIFRPDRRYRSLEDGLLYLWDRYDDAVFALPEGLSRHWILFKRFARLG